MEKTNRKIHQLEMQLQIIIIIIIIIYVFNAKINIKMSNQQRTDEIVRNQKCFQQRKGEF